jgi:hypothetical protein
MECTTLESEIACSRLTMLALRVTGSTCSLVVLGSNPYYSVRSAQIIAMGPQKSRAMYFLGAGAGLQLFRLTAAEIM